MTRIRINRPPVMIYLAMTNTAAISAGGFATATFTRFKPQPISEFQLAAADLRSSLHALVAACERIDRLA